MGVKKKVCPLLADPSFKADCIEGNCAIWDAEGNYCAILSIADAVWSLDKHLHSEQRRE